MVIVDVVVVGTADAVALQKIEAGLEFGVELGWVGGDYLSA